MVFIVSSSRVTVKIVPLKGKKMWWTLTGHQPPELVCFDNTREREKKERQEAISGEKTKVRLHDTTTVDGRWEFMAAFCPSVKRRFREKIFWWKGFRERGTDTQCIFHSKRGREEAYLCVCLHCIRWKNLSRLFSFSPKSYLDLSSSLWGPAQSFPALLPFTFIASLCVPYVWSVLWWDDRGDGGCICDCEYAFSYFVGFREWKDDWRAHLVFSFFISPLQHLPLPLPPFLPWWINTITTPDVNFVASTGYGVKYHFCIGRNTKHTDGNGVFVLTSHLSRLLDVSWFWIPNAHTPAYSGRTDV